MSDFEVVANAIESLLSPVISNAVFFHYIPPISQLDEFLETVVDAENRLNAWFVIRTGITSIRYGEGRRMATGQRIKQHQFIIKGYQSVYTEAGAAASELQFQSLCDDIESALAPSRSLGITDPVCVVSSIKFDIRYEMVMRTLCHSCRISLNVDQYRDVNYQL